MLIVPSKACLSFSLHIKIHATSLYEINCSVLKKQIFEMKHYASPCYLNQLILTTPFEVSFGDAPYWLPHKLAGPCIYPWSRCQ